MAVEGVIQLFTQWLRKKNESWFTNKKKRDEQMVRTIKMHRKRDATIVRTLIHGRIVQVIQMDDNIWLEYVQTEERNIRQKNNLYVEERSMHRQVHFENGQFKNDRPLHRRNELHKIELLHVKRAKEKSRHRYDRRAAVRYAERYWNDYNPEYRVFTDDCTNYVSQCLYAGGLVMHGHPKRNQGWWYVDDRWSYSWAVAHSLRWYMSGDTDLNRIEQKERASQLLAGDVICYDFNGDGRWQHTTIVVAHDANGEPLVNAHTENSRMRYWSYEDSPAWTPNIAYKFFHILEQ